MTEQGFPCRAKIEFVGNGVEVTPVNENVDSDGVNVEVKPYLIHLCQACIDGIGSECHTPGCALWLHKVDLPIHRELLTEDPEAPLRRIAEKDCSGYSFGYENCPAYTKDLETYCAPCYARHNLGIE